MEYIFNLSLDSPKMYLPALRNKLSVLHFFHPPRVNAILKLQAKLDMVMLVMRLKSKWGHLTALFLWAMSAPREMEIVTAFSTFCFQETG